MPMWIEKALWLYLVAALFWWAWRLNKAMKNGERDKGGFWG